MVYVAQTLKSLASVLPPWAFAVVAVVAAAVGLPTWTHVMRERQIRGLFRRAILASPAEREPLWDEAFVLAADVPRRLGALAREAWARRMDPPWHRARERLRVLGATGELAVLDRISAPPKGPVTHPLEAAAAVERLLEAGAVEAARKRLDEALARHPRAPELQALREVVAQFEAANG